VGALIGLLAGTAARAFHPEQTDDLPRWSWRKTGLGTVREADSCFVWLLVLEDNPMSIAFLFWLLMILWLVFGLYWNRADLRGGNYGLAGGNLMLFIVLFLLGWKVFGFPIQG
jgi:hypothetical protein